MYRRKKLVKFVLECERVTRKQRLVLVSADSPERKLTGVDYFQVMNPRVSIAKLHTLPCCQPMATLMSFFFEKSQIVTLCRII